MSEMRDTTKELKAELDKSVALLRTLRDEIRVKAHLAGMNAKDQWRDLEPRLEAAVERAAKDVSEASRQAVADATEALKRFRSSILVIARPHGPLQAARLGNMQRWETHRAGEETVQPLRVVAELTVPRRTGCRRSCRSSQPGAPYWSVAVEGSCP